MRFDKYGNLDNNTKKEMSLADLKFVILAGLILAVSDAILSSFLFCPSSVTAIHKDFIFFGAFGMYLILLVRCFFKYHKYNRLCKK